MVKSVGYEYSRLGYYSSLASKVMDFEDLKRMNIKVPLVPDNWTYIDYFITIIIA